MEEEVVEWELGGFACVFFICVYTFGYALLIRSFFMYIGRMERLQNRPFVRVSWTIGTIAMAGIYKSMY